MGTTATIQHASIVALFPVSVKDGAVVLPVRFDRRINDGRDNLSVAIHLTRELATALHDDLHACLKSSKLPSTTPSKRGRKVAAGKIESYRRVVARVADGWTWAAAGHAEGVDGGNASSWWANEQKRAAARKPGEPITKPSGKIL